MTASLAKRYGIGCGGISCLWGAPAGVATNDGCRCFDASEKLSEPHAEVAPTKKGIRALRVALAANPDIGLALDQLVLAVRAKEAKGC